MIHVRRLGAAVALLLAGLLVAAGLPGSAAAAATAAVSVSPAAADPDYATTLQLRGTGFQSVRNGFGGLYVFFGVVRGQWRPSQGGASGRDYVYVQDSEQKNNHGYQRFVAFPGDPTGYAANGGTVAADGTWRASLVVPGASFPARGRDGRATQVNCRTEQCGVITIGAHGVVNGHNETFTPVHFRAGSGAGGAASSRPSPSSLPLSSPSSRASDRATSDPSPRAGASTPAGSATDRPTAHHRATPRPQRSHRSPSPTTAAAAPDRSAAAATRSPAVARAADHDGSLSAGWLALLAVVVLLAGAGGGLWWRRRRS